MQLDLDGAVHPAAFDALGGAFAEADAAATAVAEPPVRLAPRRRLRYRWAKAFHVSPFMELAQVYDWSFATPGRSLLVQSQNLQDGALMLSTQLRLERSPSPFSRSTLLWMLLWAYPVLTWRVQWWIHVEAFRLFLKGVTLVPYPAGPKSAFVDGIHALMAPLLAVQELWGRWRTCK